MFDFAPPPPETPVPLQQSGVFNLALLRMGVDLSHHALPGGSATVLMRRIRGLGLTGVVSRGPVWSDYPDHVRITGLAEMRQALDLRHLFISPETEEDGQALSQAGFVQVARPVDQARLSLEGDPEDWRRRMDQKWRNRLNHGQRQGLVVERHDLPPRADHWLFRADQAQQKHRHFRNLPHGVLAEMARVEPGSVQLFIARADREPVAAMLFLRHGTMATYQIGWSTPEGKAMSAHNLLMWHAMEALADRGHHWIDLGILNPKKTPGIDRFKMGTGAEVARMGGSWLHSAWGRPFHAYLRSRREEQ